MGLAPLFSTQGRLAPKPFALGALAVYIAGIAAQMLLSGAAMARAGVWPFILVQAALIWLWLLLHIRRSRDAGEGPAAAIGVTLLYVLSLALQLMLIAFFTSPDTGGVPVQQPSEASTTPLALIMLAVVFSSDAGLFTAILKGLIVMAFVPAAISLGFTLRTAMRPSVH